MVVVSDTPARNGKTGFWMGFVFVAVIVAAAAALYILEAEVIARVPESEAYVACYVETVDGLRGGFDAWVAWAAGR